MKITIESNDEIEQAFLMHAEDYFHALRQIKAELLLRSMDERRTIEARDALTSFYQFVVDVIGDHGIRRLD